MKTLKYILITVAMLGFGFVLNPQPDAVTEKFFPDFEVDIPTPAFQKKRGFTKYKEMMSFIDELVKSHPDKLSYKFIGESQKGKQVPMLKLSSGESEGKVRVWIQGGLHGDEPASTEGVLYMIHEILKNDQYKGLLDRLEICVVPMANIDGYEKQERDAANGLDLNRDQTKLKAKESIFLKKTFSNYNPHVALDFHEYRPYRRDFVHFSSFGITSRFDVMFLYSGNLNVPEQLRNYTKDQFVNPAAEALQARGLLSHDYVTSTDVRGDIQFNQGSINARSSATSYALSNCISTLVEVRGVALGRTSFKRRVVSTFEVGMSFLNSASEHSEELKEVLKESELSSEEIVVRSRRKVLDDKLKVIDLDEVKEIELEVKIRDAWQSQATLKRSRPIAYIIEANQTEVIDNLRTLGLNVDLIKETQEMSVEQYLVVDYHQDSYPYEGVRRQQIETETLITNKRLEAGTAIVYLNQENVGLAIEVMEPEALNSFVSFDVVHTGLGEYLPYYRLITE